MERKTESASKTLIAINDIDTKLLDCSDVVKKKVFINNHQEAFFYYIEGIADLDLIQRDFISPIIALNLEQLADEVAINNLPGNKITLVYDLNQIITSIFAGETVFVCSELPFAVSCSLKSFETRVIAEPITEKNVRGPHEGFVESIGINISLLRRKTKNNQLKFKPVTLGEQTHQKVALAYLEGIANPQIVDKLFDHLTTIKIDGLNAIGYIEQALTAHPHSLFPQFVATERPDKANAALLEGRIVIIQDGTPVVLIAPISFFSFFQALDDYSTLWIHGSFMRLLRFIALILSLILPSLYIAITSFHYYAIPLSLLQSLAESRVRVPFPPIVEVLILEATIEMLREASIRLPTYIGTAIGVVGGLIIGQASVQAGLVSDLLIIITAATAIASYVIPSYDMALGIRILRFIFILCSAAFGMIGIVICSALTICHLITLESLGQPYFQPVSPLALKDLKDTVLRLPSALWGQRQSMTKTRNKVRGNMNERKK